MDHFPAERSFRPEEKDYPPLGQAGSKPSALHEQQTRSAYIFGTISPRHGKADALVMPWCYTNAMNPHLIETSRNVADNVQAVLVMDQAGCRISDKHIPILPLPPKLPELNPSKPSGNS